MPDEIVDGQYRCEKRLRRKIDGVIREDLPLQRCRRAAIPGERFCENHLKHPVSAIKRYDVNEYNEVLPQSIAEAANVWRNLPQITDLRPELSTFRSLLNNFLKHSRESINYKPEELLKRAKFILKKKDQGVINAAEAQKRLRNLFIAGSLTDPIILSEIRKTISVIKNLATDISKIEEKSKYTLNYGQVMIVVNQLLCVLKDNIEDKDTLTKISEKISTISFSTNK